MKQVGIGGLQVFSIKGILTGLVDPPVYSTTPEWRQMIKHTAQESQRLGLEMALQGSRPKVAYLGTHIRSNVIGAVCPANGQCFTMIYNGVDTDVFQHYLDQLAQAIPTDAAKQRILIVDNASWHKSNRLNWHHFAPMFLPAYSPDFNPTERLWLRMKSDWFSDFIASTPDALIERLSTALCHFMDDHLTVASQCSFRK